MNDTVGDVLDGGVETSSPVDEAMGEAVSVLGDSTYDKSFTDFVAEINPSLLNYEHVPRLTSLAERVVEGKIKRLIVLLPPRYFKSETFSRLLPAYYLRRFPKRNVGLASYSAELAWDLSNEARERYRLAGGATAAETDAKRKWATSAGGKMWADGVGGSITGSGFNLGVIDDPMKPKHSRSRAYREAFKNWFPETWYNRREPGASMIVVMQRIGQRDPIDFLYRREVGKGEDITEAAPQHWHVACFDERHSSKPLADFQGPKGLPKTCTLEEDPREEGQILAPERFDEDEVEDQQRTAGPFAEPQRQQRTSEPTGDFWNEEWFHVFGDPRNDPHQDLPAGAMNGGRDWDTAYTKDESNSASAQVESYRDSQDPCNIYVTDVGWRWLETPELVEWMKRLEPPHHVEAKASGKSVAPMLRRENIPVSEVDVAGDKYSRAADVKPIVGSEKHGATGRIYVHASVYEKLLNGERQGLLHVKSEDLRESEGDLDLNDAFVQALKRHTGERLPDAPKSRQY